MLIAVQKIIEELVDRQKLVFDKFDVGGHAPTIGEMYEGLTEELSKTSLESFKNLNLKVVSGFIVDSNEKISGQIDCMIVIGDGEEIPGKKNKYKYNVNNVIVVFEVKKTLNRKELNKAIKHLAKITRLKITQGTKGKLAYDAYRNILRKEPSFEKFENKDTFEALLKALLITESAYPVRVVLSYGGFKTEKGLRDSFTSSFSKNLKNENYSLVALPNLIICDKYSILKFNGMPYFYYSSATEWLGFGSIGDEPFKILLELIWTRLTYLMDVPVEIFGEDLALEHFAPLLKFKFSDLKGFEAIQYERTHSELKESVKKEMWEPVEITKDEWIFFQLLLECEVDISHKEIELFLKNKNINVINFCENLREKGLGHLQEGKFCYLTDALTLAILPNGKTYAADNASGRFSNWLAKNQLKK